MKNTEKQIILPKGLCPICKQKQEIIKYSESGLDSSYEFACGHNCKIKVIEDRAKGFEVCGVKRYKKDSTGKLKLYKEDKSREYKPSIDKKKHPDGVKEEWIVDKENKRWIHKIIDIKTGCITHEENVSFEDHNRKNKLKSKYSYRSFPRIIIQKFL